MTGAVSPRKRLLLLLLWVALVVEGKRSSQDGWRTGRATYYGENFVGGDDGFSIHHGSCQFGQLDPSVGTGWDVAAMSDAHPDFQGSCGKCYELACESMEFRDNYGGSVDRRTSCRDESKSITVTIVDSCPCNYVKNLYNNKRWCCGDMEHFDLSAYAFHKLAPMKHGVIGLKYRPVPCPSYEDVMPTTPQIVLPPMPSMDDTEATEISEGTLSGIGSAGKNTAPVKQIEASPLRDIELKPTKFKAPPPSLPPPPAELRIEQMSRESSFGDLLSATPAQTPEEEAIADPVFETDVEFNLSMDVETEESEEKEEEEEEEEETRMFATPSAGSVFVTSESTGSSNIIIGSSATAQIATTPSDDATDETGIAIERVSRVSSSDTTPTTGIEYSVVLASPVAMSIPSLSDEPAASSIDNGLREDTPTPTVISSHSPEFIVPSSLPSTAWDVAKCSKQQGTLQVYDGGFHECFTDGGLLRYENTNTKGAAGSPAWCTVVASGRSIAVVSVGQGSFKGKVNMSFSMMAGDERPEVSVALVGTKGACSSIHLNRLAATKPALGYRTFFLPLTSLTSIESEEFEGCGQNKAADVYAVAFRNEQEDQDLEICIDAMKLY